MVNEMSYHYYVWCETDRGGPPPKEKYPDCRQSKDQPFWVIRSKEKLDELTTEIDYYIVQEYMKVGY